MGYEIPDYASQPIIAFLDYWEDSRRLLELSIEGLTMFKDIPAILEGLRKQNETIRTARQMLKNEDITEPPPEALFIGMIDTARVKADFSKKEMDAGFPMLHSQTLVGAWGALEAAIEDMLVGILMNEPQHLEEDAFAKIKVPLAEFQALDKEDRMRLLLEEVNRGSSLGRKNGADAFEGLLEKFLLSGAINEKVKKTLWEMHHVRNVIVHRNSFVDRRLAKNCPWLDLKAGEQITISHETINRYGDALCDYAKTILNRLENRYKARAATASEAK